MRILALLQDGKCFDRIRTEGGVVIKRKSWRTDGQRTNQQYHQLRWADLSWANKSIIQISLVMDFACCVLQVSDAAACKITWKLLLYVSKRSNFFKQPSGESFPRKLLLICVHCLHGQLLQTLRFQPHSKIKTGTQLCAIILSFNTTNYDNTTVYTQGGCVTMSCLLFIRCEESPWFLMGDLVSKCLWLAHT